MRRSASKKPIREPALSAKGAAASRLRRRKFDLARRFGVPADLLAGSLTETQRRCGKSSCHCASGLGHPMWTFTYSVQGEKHVLVIPAASVDALRPLLDRARGYRDAVAEIAAINAQLVALWKKQRALRR